MATATVTSKGQITVPISVRKALGLQTGSRVQFIELPDGGFELRPAIIPVSRLKGFFGTWTDKPVSVAAMNDGLAQAAAEANK